jgi:hypothetical protein
MKPFTMIAVIVFALVALAHLLRLIAGFAVTVAGIAIPIWASGMGFIFAAVLALMVAREARSKN